MRAVILPGNGCDDVRACNWYSWLEKRLVETGRFTEVVLRTRPRRFRSSAQALMVQPAVVCEAQLAAARACACAIAELPRRRLATLRTRPRIQVTCPTRSAPAGASGSPSSSRRCTLPKIQSS